MSQSKANLPRAKQAHDPWHQGEPSLFDVMSDPIVRLLMTRDGLTPNDVWPLMMDMRDCLQAHSGRNSPGQVTAQAA